MCCICDEPVAEPDNVIGGRFYCARHYAAVNRPNPSFWRAGVIQIVGMGLFAAVVAWLAVSPGRDRPDGARAHRPLPGRRPVGALADLLLPPGPAGAEPHGRIATVFLLALLLTEALGMRIIYDWFQVSAGPRASTSRRWRPRS